MALFLFTKAILEGRPIDVFNNGEMRRSFTYVDDIVEGVIRVLDKPASIAPDAGGDAPDPARSDSGPFRLYNIGNNTSVPLMRYIELLEENLGRKAEKNMLPLQKGDVPATEAEVQDLMNDVGYEPQVPVEEGIKNFVSWYKDFYGV